ncbi:MAG: tripartite tricarboxylate transporter TctB family protein [Candidatus Binatia bacterium]
MRIRPQVLLGVILVVFFAVFVYLAKDWRLQARLYPWAIGIPMLVLALAQVVLDLKGIGAQKSGDNAPVDFRFAERSDPLAARRRAINIFAWIVGYIVAIWLLGYFYSVPLLVFLYLKVRSRESWTLSIALTAAAWIFFWALFDRLLHLPFPDGALFTWLGMG